MNVSRIVVLLFAVGIIAAHADETNLTLTVGGVTYSNVTFGTVTPATVKIFHSSGIVRLPLAKLPPDLQQRFGYDPAQAADWQKVEQQQAAAFMKQQAVEQQKAKQQAGANRQSQLSQESREEIEKKSQALWVNIIQVTPDGLLVRIHGIRDRAESARNNFFTLVKESGPVLVVGHPKQGEFVDGEEIQFNAYLNGNWSYQNTAGANSTVQKWVYVSEYVPKK